MVEGIKQVTPVPRRCQSGLDFPRTPRIEYLRLGGTWIFFDFLFSFALSLYSLFLYEPVSSVSSVSLEWSYICVIDSPS